MTCYLHWAGLFVNPPRVRILEREKPFIWYNTGHNILVLKKNICYGIKGALPKLERTVQMLFTVSIIDRDKHLHIFCN